MACVVKFTFGNSVARLWTLSSCADAESVSAERNVGLFLRASFSASWNVIVVGAPEESGGACGDAMSPCTAAGEVTGD